MTLLKVFPRICKNDTYGKIKSSPQRIGSSQLPHLAGPCPSATIAPRTENRYPLGIKFAVVAPTAVACAMAGRAVVVVVVVVVAAVDGDAVVVDGDVGGGVSVRVRWWAG